MEPDRVLEAAKKLEEAKAALMDAQRCLTDANQAAVDARKHFEQVRLAYGSATAALCEAAGGSMASEIYWLPFP